MPPVQPKNNGSSIGASTLAGAELVVVTSSGTAAAEVPINGTANNANTTQIVTPITRSFLLFNCFSFQNLFSIHFRILFNSIHLVITFFPSPLLIQGYPAVKSDQKRY
jgi:hypothetical protein